MNLPSTCRGSGRCPKTGSTLRGVWRQTRTDSARPLGTSAAVLCHHRLVALTCGGREGAAPHGRVFFGRWPRNEAHLFRHAVWTVRHLHPCSGLSITVLFNLSAKLIALILYARPAAWTRAPLSRSRHNHCFPSSITRWHIDVGQSTSIEHPKSFQQRLNGPSVAIRHEAPQPWIHLFRQTEIEDVPHEGVPLSRLPFVCHVLK